MLVMMPQIHCAEGSRVKNIKKQFEVLSNDCTTGTDINSASALTAPRDCNVSDKPACLETNNFIHNQPEVLLRNCKRSVNHKEVVVKHDKCNIKRSPAFRCDRMVKGKNVTGQAREKHTSVVDKVKLFEDGNAKVSEIVSGKMQIMSGNSVGKGERESKALHKDANPMDISLGLKTATNSESRNKLGKSHDSRSKPSVSAHLIAQETEVPARYPSVNFLPKERTVSESVKRKNVVCDAQRNISTLKNKPVNNCRLNDILKSPLPPGPPPRKPPRTFAHIGSQSSALNRIPKPQNSIKFSEAIEGANDSFNCANTSIPTLVRSKTESQIQIRSKLETALSKTPSGNGTPHRSSVVETKHHNLNQPNQTVKPSSKPDLNPSALLVSCLSLGCVNSNGYEEVGAHRKISPRSGDRRESLDIRLSSADVVEARNNLVCLVRSQSEDHIYAVPFGDLKSTAKSTPRQHSLILRGVESPNNGSDEGNKGVTNLSDPEPNGLHYMCTPILSHGKLSSIDEDISQFKMGLQLKSTGIVSRGQKSGPSHLNLAGLMKMSENPLLMEHSQIPSLNNQNFDTSQQMIPAESPLDDTRESSLTHSIEKDGFNRGSKTSLCSPSTETEEENGEEEHDPLTEEILEKRKGYVRRVCSMFQKMQMENSSYPHTLMSANYHSKTGPSSLVSSPPSLHHSVSSSSQPSSSSQMPSHPLPHLFECVLLVGLTLSSNQEQAKIYEPYIKSKFPADVLVPPWIEHLCFPDAVDWPISGVGSSAKGCIADDTKKKDVRMGGDVVGAACRGRTYSLVITGPDGNRRFGYCQRVLPEGGSLCLPLNYCLISPYRANGFYFKVLAELESRHGQPEAEKTAFLQELYSCTLPGPGQIPSPSLSPSSSPSPFLASLRRPYDTRLEERDMMELFCCLEVGVFLDVFASLLLERKVLLTSKSLSKLSSCIEALQSVLYPFSWQHTFIPVLPAPMLDICHAPTPYIIGVLKGCNGQTPNVTLDEGIMVDLDTSHYLQRVGDEGSILPSRIKRALQAALRLVSGITPPPQSSTCKNDSGSDGASPVRNVLVSEAFLRMFLMVVGHYPKYISVQQDGCKVFQRELFIKAMPFHGIQMFLEWFTETAMFSAFINSRLEGRPDSGDGIFEQRAHKFCEELEKDALLFLKNYKAITKKHKTFGDRLKDWTSFS